MDISLTSTLVMLVAILALLGYAVWKQRQPVDILKIRFINYHVVQLLCIFALLLVGAHVVTLVVGRP